jgi:hypothetical protein
MPSHYPEEKPWEALPADIEATSLDDHHAEAILVEQIEGYLKLPPVVESRQIALEAAQQLCQRRTEHRQQVVKQLGEIAHATLVALGKAYMPQHIMPHHKL